MKIRNILFGSITIISLCTFDRAARAATFSFNDTTLGNGSFSWTDSGFTLSASASNGGVLSSIANGQFAGLYIAQNAASGRYTLAFSQAVTSASFQFDALGSTIPPGEQISNFAISNGTPNITYTNLSDTSFNNGVITGSPTGIGDGRGIVSISSSSPFTSLSFVHTQTPANVGFVIEQFTANTSTTTTTAVPEPFTIVGTLVGAGTAYRMRKRLKATNKL
jgi:hypothetical protein